MPVGPSVAIVAVRLRAMNAVISSSLIVIWLRWFVPMAGNLRDGRAGGVAVTGGRRPREHRVAIGRWRRCATHHIRPPATLPGMRRRTFLQGAAAGLGLTAL